ncbi:alpha/beta fold hydrolase [Sphingorhabdus sp. M41]|uniref:alpha/beta fold hydrolase n=1 Tax=Sphingorhabdus sp. M41 TaxID=1806885 RepID=UPI0018D48B8B|nr:alpha/beta hydrolase [Sphingorhabdus sp. M41]
MPDVTPPVGQWQSKGDISRAGGILHYAAMGPDDSGKPPVVLLHRLGGWLSDWRHVAALLAEGRKVIAFDLPGHGGSRWEGSPPYIQTLGETAALLVGAFDEMGIEKVDLIGTSLGGCVGVPLAALWPERVNSFSIVSSALSPKRSLEAVRSAVDEGQVDRFDANGLPLSYPESLLTETFGIIDTHAIYVESLASRKAAGLWIQPSERGVGVTDVVGTLGRITVPTLILYGSKDKAYGKYRKNAQAALPSAIFDDIPDTGAFAIQEQPATTASMLRDFIG